MNVIDGASMWMFILTAVAMAVGAAVVASFIFRPKTRARFQGGNGRYLAAVFIQAAAFITPIPVVWLLLIGRPIPAGVDVLLGVATGVALVTLLRYAPVTGPLLKELARARLEVALERVQQ
jgi:hypothetical protein